MSSKEILQKVLNLSPAEKLYLIEVISNSLNEPNKKIDNLWKEEVEKRFNSYTKGKAKTISYNKINKK
ncbi:addiction module protein [Stygiobacter electus]|uniref:Addiction module protein n=1 Tax=Stygiobacter electus TaxID=3032292 RepID=A0AAE3TCJ6_9BACT|nr:addiction module protein [Stygiobacter electus]MDF1612000.1 addiction module protein [Stygiobacter electus]